MIFSKKSSKKFLVLENHFPKKETYSIAFLNQESYYFSCEHDTKGNMASIPQGAFAAKKMREREEKIKAGLDPTKYNSKFMNSIWGEYNRYSVHNLKKLMNQTVSQYLVSPAEKMTLKNGEKNIFSAEIGSTRSVYN